MILIELDERLIALNDEANKGAAWNDGKGAWLPISADFAGRAWADGDEISEARARKAFPKADLAEIPSL